jgi:uncharacterized protein YjbI with pentapeptide repeats
MLDAPAWLLVLLALLVAAGLGTALWAWIVLPERLARRYILKDIKERYEIEDRCRRAIGRLVAFSIGAILAAVAVAGGLQAYRAHTDALRERTEAMVQEQYRAGFAGLAADSEIARIAGIYVLQEAVKSQPERAEPVLAGLVLAVTDSSPLLAQGTAGGGGRLPLSAETALKILGSRAPEGGQAHFGFSSSFLRGARLPRARFDGSDFANSDLRGSDLGGANLYGANFRSADLSGANLAGADLSHANLAGALLCPAANVAVPALITESDVPAQLEGATFYSATLPGAYLRAANLRGAIFNNADLSGAHLEGADLQAAQLRNVRLDGADLSGVNAAAADFSARDDDPQFRTTLRNASFRGANLENANFRSADLSGATFQGANLRNANLQDAILDGTVALQGAILCDTIMTDGTVEGRDCAVQFVAPQQPTNCGH